MSNVYMLTSGAYSDYRVEGIFTTQELADEAKRILENDRHNDVWDKESIQVTAMPIDNLRRFDKSYRFIMMRNGDLDPDYPIQEYKNIANDFQLVKLQPHGQYAMKCNVRADSPERAIKVANEERIIRLASGWWSHEIFKLQQKEKFNA